MRLLLISFILALLLLIYLQSREIRKLKAAITFDKDTLILEATTLLKSYDEIMTIKKLRQKYYPLSLLQAKKIVDQAKLN
ncbi:hypothetical protein ACFQ22_06480 [Lentilactobacillus raoultii]|uniref:Uncharacterized protein n=1 Tax=Lentilactobacillus raoultii TaxID=1987503 RepID=A0ABW3PRT4_9LACO|nr:hypothetical protein [Lentilactobacillus raoultii]